METKSLDLSVLEGIFDSDAAAVTELLTELSQTVDLVEARVIETCQHQDWSGARQALHEMKGMCASTGCIEIAQLCAQTEANLAAQQYYQVPDCVESLRIACDRLRSAIREAPTTLFPGDQLVESCCDDDIIAYPTVGKHLVESGFRSP
jgi:HPt (histidine-containing phosphotransfer) domain-containing protein